MSARVELRELNQLEREARRAWLANASREKRAGDCAACGSIGVHVAKQPRRLIFECLECWDARQ